MCHLCKAAQSRASCPRYNRDETKRSGASNKQFIDPRRGLAMRRPPTIAFAFLLACCALESASAGEVQKRLTPDEIAALPFLEAGTGKAFAANGKLSMLALGADHSFGTQMADDARFVAGDVTGGIITDSGDWVMEEQREQTTAAIVKFIGKN
jgi:hypothetical protein